ncbi:MAG: PAS domain-containing protein [Dehalococcoidia bacterium]|nr:MAG: PAS domain-containing protein [Dehalococcoidia bacterium]
MSLRYRIAIVLAVSIAVLLAALVLAHRLIISRAYEEIERNEVIAELQNSSRLIESDLDALDILLVDWSTWDDTYDFIQTRDPKYVTSNLTPNILESLHVDAFIFRSASGENVAARARDSKGEAIQIAGLTNRIPDNSPLVKFPSANEGVRGLINTSQGPMLVVARQILRTDESGPPRGVAVMARRLDEEHAQALGDRLNLGVMIYPIVAGVPADVARAEQRLSRGEETIVEVVDGRIVAYEYLRDISGQPLVTLRVDQERTIVAQSARTLRALLITITVTGLLLVVNLAVAFEFAVLRRLVWLRRDMSTIGAAGAGGPLRARVHGNDEIASVAAGVNEMLDRLDAAATERMRLMETVTDQQRLSDAAFREMEEGLLVLDGEGRCTACNPAGARLLGTPAERVTGRHISELLPALAPADELTRFAGPQLYEVGGRTVAVSRPVQDRPGGLSVVVLRDVTEVLDIERLKRDLVATVSHELRTPLTAIRGTVDMLDGGDAGRLTEVQSRLVNLLRTNADRLRLIVDDLLDIGALDGGRVELARDDGDLMEITRRVVEDLGPQAEAAGVGIRVQGDERVMAVVDAQRMRQVLDNLIQNALKFTPRGGSVTVTVRRNGHRVEIGVTDTGIGIPPDELERVFEKFYRTRRASQVARGTGLGLPIARSIVELHGGTLTAQSDGRTGTTMQVSIPADVPAPPLAPR